MKEILFNIALRDALDYCAANNIDCSGSHLVKYGRGFRYTLVHSDTGRAILSTTFYKNQTPSRVVHTL